MTRKKSKQRRRGKVQTKVYNHSYETKDKGGFGKKSFLDFSTVDKKVKFYEAREGTNKINIIPYEIKTKNHPLVKDGKMKVGDYDYFLDVFVHTNIGANGQSVLCPKKNYGKHCPICEEASRFYDEGKKDEGKVLLPRRRVVYNVQPIIKGEIQEVQVWETSHYLFEKELIEEATSCMNGDGIIPFADVDEGYVIKFRGSETSFGGNKYLEFKSFDFIEREEEISDEDLDNAISLDECLILLPSEEIEKILFGAEESDEEEEEEEEEKEEVDDEEEKEEEEEEEEKPVRRKRKQKKMTCPAGLKFGKDADKYDDCTDCPEDVWEKCMELTSK